MEPSVESPSPPLSVRDTGNNVQRLVSEAVAESVPHIAAAVVAAVTNSLDGRLAILEAMVAQSIRDASGTTEAAMAALEQRLRQHVTDTATAERELASTLRPPGAEGFLSASSFRGLNVPPLTITPVSPMAATPHYPQPGPIPHQRTSIPEGHTAPTLSATTTALVAGQVIAAETTKRTMVAPAFAQRRAQEGFEAARQQRSGDNNPPPPVLAVMSPHSPTVEAPSPHFQAFQAEITPATPLNGTSDSPTPAPEPFVFGTLGGTVPPQRRETQVPTVSGDAPPQPADEAGAGERRSSITFSSGELLPVARGEAFRRTSDADVAATVPPQLPPLPLPPGHHQRRRSSQLVSHELVQRLSGASALPTPSASAASASAGPAFLTPIGGPGPVHAMPMSKLQTPLPSPCGIGRKPFSDMSGESREAAARLALGSLPVVTARTPVGSALRGRDPSAPVVPSVASNVKYGLPRPLAETDSDPSLMTSPSQSGAFTSSSSIAIAAARVLNARHRHSRPQESSAVRREQSLHTVQSLASLGMTPDEIGLLGSSSASSASVSSRSSSTSSADDALRRSSAIENFGRSDASADPTGRAEARNGQGGGAAEPGGMTLSPSLLRRRSGKKRRSQGSRSGADGEEGEAPADGESEPKRNQNVEARLKRLIGEDDGDDEEDEEDPEDDDRAVSLPRAIQPASTAVDVNGGEGARKARSRLAAGGKAVVAANRVKRGHYFADSEPLDGPSWLRPLRQCLRRCTKGCRRTLNRCLPKRSLQETHPAVMALDTVYALFVVVTVVAATVAWSPRFGFRDYEYDAHEHSPMERYDPDMDLRTAPSASTQIAAPARAVVQQAASASNAGSSSSSASSPRKAAEPLLIVEDHGPRRTALYCVFAASQLFTWAWILSRCFVQRRGQDWEVIDKPPAIRASYAASWWFVIDLAVGGVPFDWVFAGWLPAVFFALQLRHVLRIVRLFKLIQSSNPLMPGRLWFQFLALCCVLCAVVHVAALTFSEIEEQSYTKSLYWAVVTVTSVGYGDVLPGDTPAARIYTSFVCVLGVLAVAMVTAFATSFLTHKDKLSENMDEKKQLMHSMLEYYRIPWRIQRDVIAMFPAVLDAQSEVDFKAMVDAMPQMRDQLEGFTRAKTLQSVPMFSSLKSTDALLALAQSLRLKWVAPQECIVLYGAEGREMYFVVRGVADVYVPMSPHEVGEEGPQQSAAFGQLTASMSIGTAPHSPTPSQSLHSVPARSSDPRIRSPMSSPAGVLSPTSDAEAAPARLETYGASDPRTPHNPSRRSSGGARGSGVELRNARGSKSMTVADAAPPGGVVPDDDDFRYLFTLRAGQFFGERALVANTVRSATIIATTHCELLILDRSDFIDVTTKHRELRRVFRRELVMRCAELETSLAANAVDTSADPSPSHNAAER